MTKLVRSCRLCGCSEIDRRRLQSVLVPVLMLDGIMPGAFSAATMAVLDCTHHAVTRREPGPPRSTTGRTGAPSPNNHDQSRSERTTRNVALRGGGALNGDMRESATLGRSSSGAGTLAEGAGHHPALLTEWGKVTVTWWTHVIGGLHRNDFVMSARTDGAYKELSEDDGPDS